MGKLFSDTRVQEFVWNNGQVGKKPYENEATEVVEETEEVPEDNGQCGVQTALCTKDMGEHE